MRIEKREEEKRCTTPLEIVPWRVVFAMGVFSR